MSRIPIEIKRRCVELSERGLNSRQIYDQYYSKHRDTKYSGFRNMLSRWKNKTYADRYLLESANLDYKFAPHDSTVQIDGQGKIVQAWIKQKADDNVYHELIEAIQQNTEHKKVEFIHKPNASRMLEVNLCDMHWGIADLDYYSETLTEILGLINSKVYDEINVIIGQDQFHNDNFKGTTTKGTLIEKVDMVKAWEDCKSFWYNIIDLSIKQSNKVKIWYVPGNHDRTMTWAFMQMLKERYKDLEIDDRLDVRKCLTYGTNFIGLTHGEFKRSKASDLRSQFSVKFPVRFANSKVKEIHCSHLHTEMQTDEYGVMVRRLSTKGKTDEWSDYEGYLGANKRFMIFEWSIDKLASIHYV